MYVDNSNTPASLTRSGGNKRKRFYAVLAVLALIAMLTAGYFGKSFFDSNKQEVDPGIDDALIEANNNQQMLAYAQRSKAEGEAAMARGDTKAAAEAFNIAARFYIQAHNKEESDKMRKLEEDIIRQNAPDVFSR